AHSSSDKSNRMTELPSRNLESHFLTMNQWVKLGPDPRLEASITYEFFCLVFLLWAVLRFGHSPL
ncbi:MAG: hypothetical protein ACI82H_000544, partial [Alphaproteobacteria bacterium]